MKRYRVLRAPAIELDWSTAEVLSDFTFPWEDRAPEHTEFRALWTEERLHFRFDCIDAQLVLGAGETAKERVLGSGRVELFFAADKNLRPYYCLEMEPRGEVLAYRANYYREMDWDWHCEGLVLQAAMDGERYRVEGSIPLHTLRQLNALREGSNEMLVGVYRAVFSLRKDGSVHSGWMPWVNPQTERPDFHVPASFGVFELVR